MIIGAIQQILLSVSVYCHARGISSNLRPPNPPLDIALDKVPAPLRPAQRLQPQPAIGLILILPPPPHRCTFGRRFPPTFYVNFISKASFPLWGEPLGIDSLVFFFSTLSCIIVWKLSPASIATDWPQYPFQSPRRKVYCYGGRSSRGTLSDLVPDRRT